MGAERPKARRRPDARRAPSRRISGPAILLGVRRTIEPGSASERIRAFLTVDVEVDGFQSTGAEARAWAGYGATYEFLTGLRPALAKATGAPVRYAWFLRTDPQIEATCGRADAALASFPERIDAMRAAGDAL